MSRRSRDITGQRFGRLVALYPLGQKDRRGSALWHCRCDCGTEQDLAYNSLMYTNLRSCGCRKREHSQELRTYLTHVAGTSVDILKSKKLPVDNTSGYKGVYYIRGKYVAKIVFQKKQYYLGAYKQPEEAAAARLQAEELLFERVSRYHELWKQRAEADPEWAAENPIRISVNQGENGLEVIVLPELAALSVEE